jgi:uncharacterized protein
MSILQKMYNKGLVSCPPYAAGSTQYEVMMGSISYGVDTDNSDIDIYGFCIPPKEIIFPHLSGEILGFGRQKERFGQWQQDHILFQEKEYDFSIYNIVKYFNLCMECNPNMIDSLFVPQRCILHITRIGNHVRENRKTFLSKVAWPRFKGYSYSQIHKMTNKNPEGKRVELIKQYGYDVKFAYHVVRLLNEVEQILTEGDIDLERNREQLKSIRRGEWTSDRVTEYFNTKEKDLESIYLQSNLRYSPDEESIYKILVECLEEYYGSLDKCISNLDKMEYLINDLRSLINKYS